MNDKIKHKADRATVNTTMTQLTLSVEKDRLTIKESDENIDFCKVSILVPACEPDRIRNVEEHIKELGLSGSGLDNVMNIICDELAIELLREMIVR